MDILEIEFWINNLTSAAIFAAAIYIYLKANKLAGILIFLAFAFMEVHSYLMVYGPDNLIKYEPNTNSVGAIDVNLVSPLWFKAFLIIKSLVFAGIPVGLVLLCKQAAKKSEENGK